MSIAESMTIAALVAAADSGAADDLVEGRISTTEWLVAVAILVGGLVAGGVVRRIVRRIFLRGARSAIVPVDVTATSLLARLAQVGISVFAFVYALFVLGVQVGPLLGAIGIGGVALAFAMQDTLENFISGLILQLRRPFVIGDQVQVAGQEGSVIDIGFRYVRLHRFDGTVALIPARMVLQDVVVNLTAEATRRTTLSFGIAAGSDTERARDVVRTALQGAPSVLEDPAPTVLLSGISALGTDLLVHYWHDPQRSNALRATDEVLERVHRALAEAGIEVAMPTPPPAGQATRPAPPPATR